MDAGYYWYFPQHDEGIPDLQSDPQIVEIFERWVAICGSDITYHVEECTGSFVGPLDRPQHQQNPSSPTPP